MRSVLNESRSVTGQIADCSGGGIYIPDIFASLRINTGHNGDKPDGGKRCSGDPD
jgi:hypothetical protein